MKKTIYFLVLGWTVPGFAPEHRIERSENRKIMELLNTQKESEENFHSGDRGHKGEYAETVTEVGEHGNQKRLDFQNDP